MIKKCTICETEFETAGRKSYCSEDCRKEKNRLKNKEWAATNKEKVKGWYSKWKSKNKSHIAKYRTQRRNTKDGYIDRFLERAKIKTPDTDLDRDFFVGLMDTCAITGKHFTFKNSYNCYHNPTSPSIDRVDSKRGYYKDNTQIVLQCINRMKNDMPNEDFLKLWRALTDAGTYS